MNSTCRGVYTSQQISDEGNEVNLGSALCNADNALPRLWLNSYKQVGWRAP
jgi:hypothetical protein